MKLNSLTILLPVYRYSSDLEIVIPKILTYKTDIELKIAICGNGLSENDSNLIDSLKQKYSIDTFKTPSKGLGYGLKNAIPHVQTEWLLITGHELPFGWSDFEQWHINKSSYDIILGSKLHPKTKIENLPVSRKIYSFYFNLFKSLIFLKSIPKDTQGTIFIKTDLAKSMSEKCHSGDYFFTSELVITSIYENNTFLEVPVIYKLEKYASSVPILKTMFIFLRKICRLALITNFKLLKNKVSKIWKTTFTLLQ